MAVHRYVQVPVLEAAMELVLCHAIKNVILVVMGLVLVLVIGIAQVTMQIMVDVGNMFELVKDLVCRHVLRDVRGFVMEAV